MHSSTCLYIQLILSDQAYDKDILTKGEIDLHEIPMLYSWILVLFMFAKKDENHMVETWVYMNYLKV